ncbi:RNA-dependent DNA polymerase [Cerasibacillus terrae]|uniref:RNA-dependent DNA polymerase n=1 Tax=Cerasibacillus terrae TaxID=2498845 RepID=A0A5C8P2G9_9BACI|nr:reverse transcriptase/maturase family protein [Cerasibacillus terrae]TXL67474.1 RNA-dependent DNA polymerase [Cerasibacillus terrae]
MKKNEFCKYIPKGYLHFDKKRFFNLKTESYVKSPEKIATHNFYPFIRYVSRYDKYNEQTTDIIDSRPRPINSKKRPIMYASHIDNFIYRYYGDELNKYYNRWVENNDIDTNVIAYRSKPEKRGNSNIEYAAKVINEIQKFQSSFILIGDFKSYFDTLDHNKLKHNVCEVLNVKRLPADWFKVFRSVTKFSYYNKRVISKYCGSDKKLKQKKQKSYFNSPAEFRKFKAIYPIQVNRNACGIPQGTAISAILSNVYSIYFDVHIKKLVDKHGGVYRRYSDDFIVILPSENKGQILTDEQFRKIEQQIYSLVDMEKLTIEREKTNIYQYNQGLITNLKTEKEDKIDYLGFVFDGINVEMRGKSPYKFYRNAYKLIEKAKKVQRKRNLPKIPYRKKLYRLYTDWGINKGLYGNFISYAMRSQNSFDKISPNTNNLMMQQIKNRKKKLEKALGYKISIKKGE